MGQLDDSDHRNPAYLGRGIGLRLLDELVGWAATAACVLTFGDGGSRAGSTLERL